MRTWLGYTREELEDMEPLHKGHYDNLVVQTDTERVWVSRLTREDGAKQDHEITLERLTRTGWVACDI